MRGLAVERTQSRPTDFPAGDGPDGRTSEGDFASGAGDGRARQVDEGLTRPLKVFSDADGLLGTVACAGLRGRAEFDHIDQEHGMSRADSATAN